MVCISASIKWPVWIHTWGAFSGFLPYLFDSWEESHSAKWIKTGSGRFHTQATADCYTSPMGGKIEEKIQKKATFLVAQYHKTKVWTWCLSQPHATCVQFFIIVLHHSCQLLETSVAVDNSPNIEKEKLAERQTTPAFFCGLAAAAQITSWCGKKICNAATCRSTTAPHEWNQAFIFSMFANFAVTAAASASHPYRIYGFIAFESTTVVLLCHVQCTVFVLLLSVMQREATLWDSGWRSCGTWLRLSACVFCKENHCRQSGMNLIHPSLLQKLKVGEEVGFWTLSSPLRWIERLRFGVIQVATFWRTWVEMKINLLLTYYQHFHYLREPG